MGSGPPDYDDAGRRVVLALLSGNRQQVQASDLSKPGCEATLSLAT